MVASVPEEMTCDVHDRGRERYLHGTRPPTQRVLRRRLLRDPDANGRRTLRVGETAAPDLPEHAPELRLTFGDPAALWQTTASQRLVRRDRAVAPSGHADVPDESGAGGGPRRGERGRRKLRQRPIRMGAYGWLGCRPGPVHLWLTGPAGSRLGQGMGLLVDDVLDLAAVYTDLHAHPELGFHETRTAALVAVRLSASGFEVTTGVGGTGVVGVLGNGDGPLVLLRADMDALPVEEKTGLPYASVTRALTDSGIDVPVMHACGHDVHVTCLLGACAVLSADAGSWSGTLVVVFQPAEELGAGARAMVEDGLFDRFDRPAVVPGQHVAPLPAGIIGLRHGAAFAAADTVSIVLHGRGGHGSRPEASVDPVVMAAATVMRLQTIVSRELAGTDTAVVTIGSVRAGTAANIIPDRAELQLSIRTTGAQVRTRVLAAVERIVRGEAVAAGAPRDPEITLGVSFPAVVNDPDAATRTQPALEAVSQMVLDPGLVTGSEDVGVLATAAGAPCVFWILGGADPAGFEGATTVEQIAAKTLELPSNHSPMYAPQVVPTLDIGAAALVAAARKWLGEG